MVVFVPARIRNARSFVAWIATKKMKKNKYTETSEGKIFGGKIWEPKEQVGWELDALIKESTFIAREYKKLSKEDKKDISQDINLFVRRMEKFIKVILQK